MAKALGVGVIGASADRGWAKVSHIPAVQQLTGMELAAVVSGSQAKADAAAKAFSAKAAYGDAQEMVRDANVDIVSICVKVPDHRELVLSALAAGKHVYCEWPLGRDLAETEELAAAAQSAGVHVAIGLQTRRNPAAMQARSLLASGGIGRLLSARVYSTTMAFGPKVEEAMAFAEKGENGVTLVSIQGAHTFDLAIMLLGQLDDAAALTTIQFPKIEIGENATKVARSIPDHILVEARCAGGASLAIEVAGGRPADATPFRLEITGEDGDLVLSGGAPRGFQSGRLALTLKGKLQQVDQGEFASMPEEASNVAGIYEALRDDIARGTATAPDFAHAVRLTRLVDDLLSSAQTGARKTAAHWPL